MPGRLSFTMLDFDREKSTTGMYTGEVTAVSLPGLLTQVGTLRAAIDAVTLGTVHKESLTVFDTVLSQTAPTDPYAQRESKWLVVYEDVTAFFDAPVNAIPNEAFGRLYTLEIGTADLSLLAAGTGLMDSTTDEYGDLKTALEATLRSPAGGAISVVEIRHVGRNS